MEFLHRPRPSTRRGPISPLSANTLRPRRAGTAAGLRHGCWRACLLFAWVVLGLALAPASLPQLQAAETNALPEGTKGAVTNLATDLDPDLALRTYLKLQEQLHVTLLAIERSRQEASLEARTNSEVLAARLEMLEQSMARQRDAQSRNAEASQRSTLLLVAGVIGLGVVALILNTIFQSRGLSRLAQIAATLPHDRGLAAGLAPGQHLMLGGGFSAANGLTLAGGGFGQGNGNGNGNGAGPGAGAPVSRVLLDTVERLQGRIQELERAAQPELPMPDLPASSAASGGAWRKEGQGDSGGSGMDQALVLLGQAQVLLSLGQAEEALGCCDRAVAEAPDRAEPHLRRGQALERLKRYEEAVASYDRAISLNRHLTQAYLNKGAVYNHQERYSDALACYEQALRVETRA